MNLTKDSRFALLAGASALAVTAGAGSAMAQADDTRTLGAVVVTTQKQEESIQDVPIAVSAFDEGALEKLQLSGGPDLVKSIPNVTFSKGNFTGSNFKIRGVGADLVAQSGDAGVGVHQNDVPLTANRLFEAEYFDVERVEVLRGPQGTLYGRNATGGVINVITAKPVLEEYQGRIQATVGNYDTVKLKGMANIPVGETIAVRLAGSYLSRGGFADNLVTGNEIDTRELYGVRGTIAWEPTERFRTWLLVEHFEEDDTRIRSGKQLCAKDPFETSFAGIPIGPADQIYTSLGCREAPLDKSLDRVNSAATLGGGLGITAGLLSGDAFTDPLVADLRKIESAFDPIYEADQTLYEFKAEFDLTDALTATYLGSTSTSNIISVEDYNKVAPTVAFNEAGIPLGNPALAPVYQALFPGGVVSDPQLGTSNIFRTFDISGGRSEQSSHELRLQSDFEGRFNFNLGAIYAEVEAIDPSRKSDGYYVLSNTLTAVAQINNALGGALFGGLVPIDTAGDGTGPILENVGGDGGNYFRTLSPYRLESFAVFGEGYYDVSDTLTLTLGLRYTDDQKEQDVIPTFLFTPEAALPPGGALEPRGVDKADFQEVTGRVGFDWAPDLGFTEDTLVYAFYSKGYKGGGINPPQPAGNANAFPSTFEPEFVNAFEVGTKNTLDGGAMQLNATGFYYDYEGYQITQIINRTSANFNIDAEIQGLEVETIWSPVSSLVLNANLGLLDSEIKDSAAIDVLDRTNGDANFVVLKNAASFSNCVISSAAYATVLGAIQGGILAPGSSAGLCTGAFVGQEAAFGLPSGAFTPLDGFAKDLSGNELPGTPNVTLNFGAEYSWEGGFGGDWTTIVRADYYYQDDSFSRVWNTGRDVLESWDNLNLSLKFINEPGEFEIELFGKNVTDEEVITGAYLTDDSSGLFTNIFLTEPATYGITLTKNW